MEKDKADEAALQGKPYKFIIEEKFRWTNWAMPKGADGKLDHHKAMTGKDLVDFVDLKLFPYLSNFKLQHSDNPQTIEYKIGEIFSELKNKVKSGYNLREVLDFADELPFRSTKDKHELSHLYESKIKNMGNAGRNGGQFYTPRPLIRAIIEVVKPKIGERIYDGACGSCGFLCESFEYLTHDREKLSTTDLKTLQEKTFYGKEKKNLAYIIGVMNMILHGIEAPNIIHTNTLSENIRDIQERDRYHVILANPPFGGKERPEVQQNFDIKTGETAFLFLQHFIKNLKAGGRAGIVIKNTFLSNSDNASVSLRKYLLESCNLHTVLDMPQGTFLGAGVKTVVLFFDKGEPTKHIWFYQLDAGRNMGKTNSLNDDDLKEFVTLQKSKPETERSWNFSISNLNTIYDLSVSNPNKPNETELRSPENISSSIQNLGEEANEILANINEICQSNLNEMFSHKGEGWVEKKLGEVSAINYGYTEKANSEKVGPKFLRITDIQNNNVDWESVPYCTCSSDDLKKYKLETGDIVFARTGATTGKSFLITNPPNAVFASYLIRVKISSKSELLPELVYFFFQTKKYWDAINAGVAGAAQGGFNATKLSELNISFPKSIQEQKEIVSELNTVFSEAKKLENIYQMKFSELQELKKSILQKAFSGELKTKAEATA